MRVQTAGLSGLYVFSTFSSQGEREKLSYLTRIHDLSSLWHLRSTNSLSNGCCLCEHLLRLNLANSYVTRIYDLSSLWYLRVTSSLSNESCLCEHRSSLNPANEAHSQVTSEEFSSQRLQILLGQVLLRLPFSLTARSHASSVVLKSLAYFAQVPRPHP